MNKILLMLIFLVSPLAAEFESVYKGTVGQSKIMVYLNSDDDSEVMGFYKSLTSGKTYYLKGHNKFKGKLVLTEYVETAYGHKAMADVSLSKSIASGKVVWSGVMKNYDGRHVQMKFTKVIGD